MSDAETSAERRDFEVKRRVIAAAANGVIARADELTAPDSAIGDGDRGHKVSLCGDAGGEPRLVPALLAAGLRAVSVSPAALDRTKAAITAADLSRRAG